MVRHNSFVFNNNSPDLERVKNGKQKPSKKGNSTK